MEMKYRVGYGADGAIWIEPDVDNGKTWSKIQDELQEHYTKLGMIFIQEGRDWGKRSEKQYFDKGINLYYNPKKEDIDPGDDSD
jgi:hypothetical protein